MGSVYRMTLQQLTGRWRLGIMTVLAAMPVIITAVMLGSANAPSVAAFETMVLSTMLAGSIAPLVALAIAAPAFANEIEDRTLANLTLTPLPRWQIVVPKLLALGKPFDCATWRLIEEPLEAPWPDGDPHHFTRDAVPWPASWNEWDWV